MYTKMQNEGNLSTIKYTDDNGKVTFIPVDAANIDFRKCLEWVSEGNTLEEAD
jgi:hypothetical protein